MSPEKYDAEMRTTIAAHDPMIGRGLCARRVLPERVRRNIKIANAPDARRVLPTNTQGPRERVKSGSAKIAYAYVVKNKRTAMKATRSLYLLNHSFPMKMRRSNIRNGHDAPSTELFV